MPDKFLEGMNSRGKSNLGMQYIFIFRVLEEEEIWQHSPSG